ncbi:MAG: ABC transporter substrate-binding protein [Propionibacterium sp.]|nr:ABC transporter substrate-binding protein [Propionibacterium sp.]MDN6565791.1 ABC transporter substrate-binding protein [Actinomyces sp.]MDN6794318.1 ABC transporter substrate-binding protein [Propionibacterium sp.]
MRRTLAGLATTAAVVLLLSGCSDPSGTDQSASGGSASSGAGQVGGEGTVPKPFDTSSLSAVPEIAALVPDDVKERGTLRNGSDTSYAPAEFLGEDGQTPVGYDIDIVNALARLMGLSGATSQTAEFPAIIPALGSKYDIGASSYTITQERLAQVNMISYITVGSSYAVAEGNPKGFDPTDPCGSTLGVQNGTTQFDYANELAEKCRSEGKPELKVMPLDLQTDVSTKVIGGQYDATLADTTVIGWTVKQAGGKLEHIGEDFGAADQGLAVAKDDTDLAQAVQAGLQYLMDNGQLTQILEPYGVADVALTTAELNPSTDE